MLRAYEPSVRLSTHRVTPADVRFFEEERASHEAKYVVGSNPRQQSGFGRDERRHVIEPFGVDISGPEHGFVITRVVCVAAGRRC
jgi:hypothetical protein